MNIFKNMYYDAKSCAITLEYRLIRKRLNSLKVKDFDAWCRATDKERFEGVLGKIIQVERFHSNSGSDGYYGEDVAVATDLGKIYVIRDYDFEFRREEYIGSRIIRFDKDHFEYE